MFCPKCKAEYREGFTECADCNVALVYKLEEDSTQLSRQPIGFEYENLTELLTTNRQDEIAFFKSILEREKIPYLVQGEHANTGLLNALTMRFLVPWDYLEKARGALIDFL
jgi:hypothetical protein